MKTKYSSDDHGSSKVDKPDAKTSNGMVAPIPLERPEVPEFNKSEGQTYKLRNDPADKDSPGYEVSVRYFSSGTCEEFLTFETDIKRVFKGQNITAGPARFEVTRRLLTGGALTTFNAAAAAPDMSETLPNWNKCMNAVRDSVFPKRANVIQRQMMRQGKLRKPVGMNIQQYVDRMRELNSYLKRFPPISSTAKAKDLDAEEFIESIESAIPNSWNKQMTLLGFLPHENSLEALVEKCQCFEVAESHEKGSGKKNHAENNKKGKGKRSHDQTKDGNKSVSFAKPKKYNGKILMCKLHGYKHPMQECRTIKEQVDRMHAMYEAQDGNERRKKRKEEKSFRELNTVEGMNKLVAKKVEEQLAKMKSNKRQKKDLNNFENLRLSESESESEEERSLIDVPSSSDED